MTRSKESLALNYLSYRDRSRHEMSAYLNKKGFTDEEIEECLVKLKDWNLLDDEKFCRNYINYSKGKARGSLRIKKELKQKGIENEILTKCMEEEISFEGEIELATALTKKMLEEETELEISDKLLGRIARRLASRGFPGNVTYTVLNKVKRLDIT